MDTVVTPYAIHAARVRALPLAHLRKRLIEKAGTTWGVKEEDALQLANDAVLTLIKKGAEKWDAEADPTAWNFLLRQVNEARKRDAKKAFRRRTELDTEAVEESPPSSDQSPRTLAIHREEATRARDELLRRLADNELAVRVVRLCIAEGAQKPGEIAEHLGEDLDRIYKCQERIRREIKRMVAEQRRTTEATEGEVSP